jgi:hypothetical protein
VANLISSMDRSSPLELVSRYTVELIGHQLTLNINRPSLPSFCGVPFHHSSVGFSLVYPASFRFWRLEKVFTSAPSRRCPAQLHRRLLPLCLWLISLPSTPTTPFLAQFGAIAGSSRHGHATLVTTIPSRILQYTSVIILANRVTVSKRYGQVSRLLMPDQMELSLPKTATSLQPTRELHSTRE